MRTGFKLADLIIICYKLCVCVCVGRAHAKLSMRAHTFFSRLQCSLLVAAFFSGWLVLFVLRSQIQKDNTVE